MQVVILTEGGKEIGLGHLGRCSALAKQLSKHKSVSAVVLVVKGDSLACGFLKSNNVDFINFDWIKNARKTIGMAQNADAVIIDSYLAPKSIYRSLHSDRRRLVAIDDYDRLDYEADFIVNPSVCSLSDIGYNKRPGIKYLAGKDYIILREEIRNPGRKVIRKDIENILITLGGRDNSRFLAKVVDLFSASKVVVNVINPGSKNLESVAAKTVKVFPALSAQGLRGLMREADLCISAGGQTLNELALNGVPTVGICFADNQLKHLNCWKEEGFLEFAGWFNQKGILAEIGDAVSRLMPYEERLRRSRIGRRTVDGEGVERIAKEVLSGTKDAHIRLRPAVKADSVDIFNWRNHPEVRKWCFSPKKIDFKSHNEWLNLRISNPRVRIFIAEEGPGKCGVIRFEEGPSSIQVNVNLNPGFLNCGIGNKIIKLGTERALRIFSSGKPIVASIKRENIVSQKAFAKAGYTLSGNSGSQKGYVVYEKKI